MTTIMSELVRVTENPANVARYDKILSKLHDRPLSGGDPVAAENLMSKAAEACAPTVWREYWEHVLIAPQLGGALAESAAHNGINVDPNLVEYLLHVHDIGRMVNNAYLHNDDVTTRILKHGGMPSEALDELPSTRALMQHAQGIGFSEDQLKMQAEIGPNQQEQVDQYHELLTPTQRIVNIADNLGKRMGGHLFTMANFAHYLAAQETRYSVHSNQWGATSWSVDQGRRPAGALLQYLTVEKSLQWLRAEGVQVDDILEEFSQVTPTFEIFGRRDNFPKAQKIIQKRHFDRFTVKGSNNPIFAEPHLCIFDLWGVYFTSYPITEQ